MLFVFGIITYLFFIISIFLFISAILSSASATEIEGRTHINTILISSMIFMGLYLIGSIGVILMAIIKSIRKEIILNGELSRNNMRRVNSEALISAIVTGSP